MSKLFAQIRRAQLEKQQAAIVAHALRESTGTTHHAPTTIGRHTPGDATRLRGIPVVGVIGGEGGAIRGTRPGQNLR